MEPLALHASLQATDVCSVVVLLAARRPVVVWSVWIHLLGGDTEREGDGRPPLERPLKNRKKPTAAPKIRTTTNAVTPTATAVISGGAFGSLSSMRAIFYKTALSIALS
jgi:hypothetical protein